MQTSPTIAAATQKASKLFGTFAALRQVSCSFAKGGLHVILGENGAGKSTLLRLFAGLSLPSAGDVTVLDASPRDAQSRVAYMSHASMLYDEMTPIENLHYFSQLYKQKGDCGCAASPEMALRSVGLDPALTRPVGHLSQGMRQRASLARVLMADPLLLLLDEPFSNLDAAGSRAMLALLQDFLTWPATQPRTVILTTHQADLVTPIATSVLQLHRGAVAAA